MNKVGRGDDINTFKEDIQKLGLKATPQRMAILEYLNGNRNHPAAEDVYATLIGRYPGLSRTTVYNVMAKLVERNVVRELDIDPQRKRFDAFTEPHDHFYCRSCGNVFDVPADPSAADLRENGRKKNMDGHQLEALCLNFTGVCRHCSSALSSRTAGRPERNGAN
ncbi:MAG: transcriptional repressor [Syntrophales bacterium]|jgi:Fur family peroxide stress response transcriptional regulator|nr:transcriptional repressor [Syntrophales bacterium]